MGINDALSKREEFLINKRGEGLRAFFQQQIDASAAALATTPQIEVGTVAPDFELLSTTGSTVTLSDVLQTYDVILNFYRGGWCAFCDAALPVWQRALPKVEAAGAKLFALSPETVQNAAAFKARAGLGFDLLSDHGCKVASQYGLTFNVPQQSQDIMKGVGIDVGESNGTGEWLIPATATFVIARDGSVRASDVGPDYKRRMDPADALAALA